MLYQEKSGNPGEEFNTTLQLSNHSESETYFICTFDGSWQDVKILLFKEKLLKTLYILEPGQKIHRILYINLQKWNFGRM
jgi:hypothetical protein